MIIGPGNLEPSKYNNSQNPKEANKIDKSNAKAIFAALASQVKFCKPCTIYLLSCNMEVKQGGIAQMLADATGCTVHAPMGYCWPNVTEPEKSKIKREYENHKVYDNSKDDTFNEYTPSQTKSNNK